MGITNSTPYHVVYGAGQITVQGGPANLSAAQLGATKDGTTLRLEIERYWPELDGAVGPIMGTGRINRLVAFLETTLVELELDWMVMAFNNLQVYNVGGTYEYIGYPDDLSRCILEGDHFDWVRFEESSCETETPNTPATYRVTLFNAVCTENLEIPFNDDNEASYRLTFMATWDPADIDRLPFEIRRTPPSV